MRRLTLYLSLIFIFTIPFEGVIAVAGVGTLTRLFGLLLTGLWFLTVLYTGQFRRPHPFHLAMAIFFLWNVASIYWTLDSQRTMARADTYLQLLLLSLIIWDIYMTPVALRAGLQAYVLGAYVTVGFIIVDFLTREAANGRYGTGDDFNEVSLTLAIALPFAWYLATSLESNKYLRWVNLAYIPLGSFGIVLGASRTGLLATLPAFFFILISMQNLKIFQRVIVFLLLIASLLTLQSIVPAESIARLSETGSSISEGNLTGRVDIWAQGIQVFFERPIIGVGSGAFKQSIELNQFAHNVFLSVLVELGIIGFMTFAAVLAIVFWSALSQPKLESRLWLTVLLIWTIGVMSLTWEHRKPTWLIFTFVVVSANLMSVEAFRSMTVGSFSGGKFAGSAPASVDTAYTD